MKNSFRIFCRTKEIRLSIKIVDILNEKTIHKLKFVLINKILSINRKKLLFLYKNLKV